MSNKIKHLILALSLTTIGIVIIFNSFNLGVSTYIWFWIEASDSKEYYHPYTIGFFVYLVFGILISNTGLKIFVKWLFNKY
ncbi:hypothetical protein GCM10007111_04350 [Virgibacillus kapii]|uniref:Uncharacterized protein n=1 Tax=Virgibacillus kapii TaxID=1638645 RepID=A0ABQ2D423_9BACI|nr:hypothetical protein GCM10007111_04350 [Virgibacillus kapii]